MRASKRQLVVDTATELFSKHGFHPVGVDWIIDDSRVARMTLYRHFPSKDDLIREVLIQRYDMIVGSIDAQLQHVTDPVERVKTIFDWYEAWFNTPAFAGCLFERALAEFGTAYSPISDVAIRYRRKMVEWIAELLADLVSPETAKRLATVYMMLLDGATVEARAFNDSASAGRAWQAAKALLEQEVRAHGVRVESEDSDPKRR
ncbi:TetR/AcrR family transcriptional regulator [Burkholderia dolosa]|uniref:TetR/AcrR family transcriptional regulator n=1 Tax=Burkholderia dolosa TaxID=152500 RepID=A0A892IEC6_9BURK|nr:MULTISPECIES: TetR/AcrR family transcriptional regulator [Burkholderia]AKE05150.1 TetR family transcriptional regulator [Burkholderia cepacia]AJY09278.1 bacterial regulatory s, tetR family protein [Burkholderia dolosa AU0158]AYZ94547.1 TetR/AcrR family transcriptional regulator [Burkholderia dolosa]ETP63415.1 TetR family transcriptional regulator [Burkholderia dolosa PC543]MBR8415969.1 TetR/AcrR family transcriptional regulator [Burkholderia dolosa]